MYLRVHRGESLTATGQNLVNDNTRPPLGDGCRSINAGQPIRGRRPLFRERCLVEDAAVDRARLFGTDQANRNSDDRIDGHHDRPDQRAADRLPGRATGAFTVPMASSASVWSRKRSRLSLSSSSTPCWAAFCRFNTHVGAGHSMGSPTSPARLTTFLQTPTRSASQSSWSRYV